MILDEIVSHKRNEVEAQKGRIPMIELEERVTDLPPARDFCTALRADGISLIAEVKRASPSKGPMMPDVDAVDLAALYEECGARAISVLTDQKYFMGALDDLTAVRQHVGLPCLRKEFVIDSYQIYQSRAAHADALLLIARILTDTELAAFIALARKLGVAPLVEVHTAEELERALAAGAHIVGINNRDLDTLEVSLNVTMDLKRHVPGGVTLVSESGIYSRDHVKMLEDGGVDAMLVGESLLTSGNIAEKMRELLGVEAVPGQVTGR